MRRRQIGATVPTVDPTHLPSKLAPPTAATQLPERLAPPTGGAVPATQLPLQLTKPTRRPSVIFDVPSFARWMYKGTFGIDIGRSIQQQRMAGQLVDRSRLQWGDLLFFHGDEHMGIYIDAGMFIQTPGTGDVLKLSPLAARADFVEARRVFSPK